MKVWDFLSSNNVGNRDRFNGTKEQQFVGLLGELKVKEYLNLDTTLNEGFDGGYDFYYKGYKIDVKTMGRNVAVKSNYVNNFVSLQVNFDCDIYIFCSLNKTNNILTICGWVTKEQLLERAKYYEKGTIRVRSDNSQFILQEAIYEIENYKLNKMEDLI